MTLNFTTAVPVLERNSPGIHIFGSIVITIVVMMTISGNVFNLLVLTTTPRLRTNPGYFMMSLAVADLGAGFVNLVSSIPSSYLNYWPYGQVICDLAGFFAAWFYTVSIYTLTAVSVDRYMAITFPLRYHNMVPKRYCFISILVIWIMSSFIFLIPFMGYGFYEYKWTAYICMCDFTKHFWITMAADFLVVVPCTVLTAVCYLKIYIISRRHTKEVQAQNHNQAATKRSAKLKALKTISITVLAFYISWLPFTMQQTVLLFLKGVVTPPGIDFVLNWIAIGNSFMNCIIYSCTNRLYRNSGKRMLMKLCCHFCPGKKVESSSRNGTGDRGLNLTISLG